MKHTIDIDGVKHDLDIRAMGEDFVVYRKMYVPPLTRENIGKVNPGDWAEHLERFRKNGWQNLIERFLRDHIRAIGSCAILAWDGDAVIGKMYFTTKEMWDAFRGADCWFCVEHESMPHFIQSSSDERIQTLLASPSQTLQILCFNIGHQDRRYHGQGIAKAMVEYLKQWARRRGWRRLVMESCPDITPTVVLGEHVLRRGTLERRGFHVAKEQPAPPEEAEHRLRVIKDLAAGKTDYPEWADWFVENFPRLSADSGSRLEYDKNYVMAYEL
jgi:GNAT superfamily N-acetyltransferase